ncbi:MAG TPA: FAD-dependent oxidoreductase [Papillibacter sp.]|nr:FAD-dependent oxidoreductase [Papillibacter sp.]
MGSDYKHVFSPITIRGVEFKNRIEMAPTSPKLTSEKGYMTMEHIDYFRPIARGGAAIVTLGNCSIDIANAQDEPRQVGVDNDDYLIGLSRFNDMCERYGALGSLEINHSGIDAVWEFNRVVPLGPSAVISPREMMRATANGRKPVRPVEMTIDQIQELEQMYIDAAHRCKRAGMKICLVHGGHGNLIGQFSSPLYNLRRDEYGGSLENRARFAMNILDGIRKKCGEDFVIEFRVSADEMHPDGMRFEETKEYLKLLDDKIDIVNVSSGLHTDVKYFRYWFPNMYMPRMNNVHYAAELKKILKCKVTAVAGITHLDNAEKIIAEGMADFCAMARPLMADPEMPRKYAMNKPEERVPCSRCGYCNRRVGAIKTLMCGVNPKLGREHELEDGMVRRARVQKTVAVVGAGPAGMQATLTLLERGHKVVLFEQEQAVGGNLTAAAAMELKLDMKDYHEYLCRTVMNSGADIRLGVKVTPETIQKLNPDALVIAVGAKAFMPDVPGIDSPHVHWAVDADMDKVSVGEEIAIIGGGSLGLESAYTQSQRGKKVRLFEIRSELGADMGAGELMPTLEKNGVEIFTGRRLLSIHPDKICCVALGTGEMEEYPCDTVLISAGLIPRKQDIEALRHLLPETEVYIVGDAKEPRSLGDAVHDGFNAALNI